MNVAIIADVLGKPNNGTTLATYNLINSLKKKGHHVNVVCPDEDKRGLDGYYIAPINHLGPVIDKVVEKNGVVWAKADDETLKAAIKDADVVHVEMPYSLGNRGAEIAKEYGKPLTASFHCQAENFTSHIFLMNSHLANHLTYKTFYRNLYSKCDAIHYPTQFIRDVFESEIDKKTNGYVISNGVNKEFFGNERLPKKTDKFAIVCSGRLCGEKAQHILIKAVAKSRHKDDIKIFFAGDGPCKDRLIRLANRYSVNADFKFYDRSELKNLLLSGDLYVHTATAEIEAISCLEAIVSGLVPIICNSDKSATRYFALDENNLFEKGNPDDLAAKIDFYYENAAEKEKCAEKYRGVIEAFDLDNSMNKMEEMLVTAAAKGV